MTVKHSMFVILHKYANAEILSATNGSTNSLMAIGTGWQLVNPMRLRVS
ncbi:MAG: hypothetical protein IPI28_08610 [Candidatus Omnitrophica bacterium]|nr:hypothetical protein [Candidatus Omnitrophota bacterium]